MTPTDDFTIYALKTDNEENAYWKPRLFESLKNGIARFGWSYEDTADLRKLQARVEKGDELTEDESKCWAVNFLLRIVPGDYLVYINMPEYGHCTMARVQDSYRWDKWDKDFNHAIPVYKDSVMVFDRNDKHVHPALQRRLKLQGRQWTISTREEFVALLRDLDKGLVSGEHATPQDQLDLLVNEISPLMDKVAEGIHHTHPGKTLEPLIAGILAGIPGVESVKQMKGPADKGADIVFEYQAGIPFGGLERIERCGVQVKAYENEMDYDKAIDDLRRAFEFDPSLTSGLIISTALRMTDAFQGKLDALRNQCGREIGVILGRDLAVWFLEHRGSLESD